MKTAVVNVKVVLVILTSFQGSIRKVNTAVGYCKKVGW